MKTFTLRTLLLGVCVAALSSSSSALRLDGMQDHTQTHSQQIFKYLDAARQGTQQEGMCVCVCTCWMCLSVCVCVEGGWVVGHVYLGGVYICV